MFWTKNRPTHQLDADDFDALARSFSADELAALAGLSTKVEVPVGYELTTQGQLGSEAHVIVEGTASVVRDGVVVAQVRPGDIVGEMAIVDSLTRTATVVADTPMQVYALSAREFRSLLAQSRSLAKRVDATIVDRLAELADAAG